MYIHNIWHQVFYHLISGINSITGAYAGFSEGGGAERGGGVPRSAKEANNPILLKVQSLQLSFRPAGVSLGGGGGAKAPPGPPLRTPLHYNNSKRLRKMHNAPNAGVGPI